MATPIQQILRTSLRVGAISLLFARSVFAADFGPMPTAPCTKLEKWAFNGRLNNAWSVKFTESLQSQATAAPALISAVGLYQRSPLVEVKAFGQYWSARIALLNRMPHLAASLFNRILEEPSEKTVGVRIAVLECLNTMQEKYPSLTAPDGAFAKLPDSALTVSEPQRSYIRDAALFVARRRLASNTSGTTDKLGDQPTDLGAEQKWIAGSSSHETYLSVIKASQTQNEDALASLAEKIPENYEPPSRFKADGAFINVALARGLYGKGKFQKAIAVYKRVPNSSNFISTAITERAWASLLQDRTAEAIGTSSNLIVGGLKKTFAPEAFAVGIIALTETCNYPQALELIKAFRKTYGPAYKWLYDWRANPNYDQAQMYPLLTGFLKKKGAIPERVGLEWIRSPIFTSIQEEINSVLEEKTLANRVWARNVASVGPRDRTTMAAPLQGVKLLLGRFVTELPTLETALLKKLNQHLLNRNRAMLSYLADVSENIQRVEVEVFNALGEKMILDNARGGKSKKVDNSRDRKKGEEGPVWDWGKFSTATDEEAEIWEDELGFLKADLNSRCSK